MDGAPEIITRVDGGTNCRARQLSKATSENRRVVSGQQATATLGNGDSYLRPRRAKATANDAAVKKDQERKGRRPVTKADKGARLFGAK